MTIRYWLALSLAAALIVPFYLSTSMSACCPAPPSGEAVVNADQTVVIVWDAATKTQHFIRQASFKSDGEDFGFLVPSPSEPVLDESGNEAFPFLQKLTEPVQHVVHRPQQRMGCACSAVPGVKSAAPASVEVLQEKMVAGFHAVVLEASSAGALADWLKEHDYAYSPAIEAWAKPYVDEGWKITALKVAKDKSEEHGKDVNAAALRMSFKTDRPLFPYREPDSANMAETLGIKKRLLRIYFLGDARYQGELTKENPWTGKVAWANKLAASDRKRTLELLKLPETSLPAECWLTEFEDAWPYQVAPADLYFSKASNQGGVARPPIRIYASSDAPPDIMPYVIAAAVIAPMLIRIRRKKRPTHSA